MTETPFRPAWSQQFDKDAIRSISASGPIAQITRDWAWGGSTGQGMSVAIIDSGIEHDHPALGDSVKGGIVVEFDQDADNWVRIISEDAPLDVSGHGTACAGIIHGIAPEAALYSVRVLGSDMKGRAFQFAAGIEWATQNGMHVANLSLSTSRQEYFGLFHGLADKAYFGNVVLVSAVNNLPVDSFPSLYASVVSVAAASGK